MNFEVNALGTFRVLDAARRAGIERAVLASTGGALIGDATPPVNEQSLPKPISPYGASKLAGEGTRTPSPRRTGFAPSPSGSATCTGHGAPVSAACSMSSSSRSTPARLWSSTAKARRSADDVHVNDISSALQLGLEKDVPGGTVLHAASGVETTVKDLADLCRQAAGVPGHPVEYRPKRAGEVGRNFASDDLANQVLGYAPSVTVRSGSPGPGRGSRRKCSGTD